VFRSGNSIVISFPEELLSAYGLGIGAEVDILNDPEHGGLLVKPAAPKAAGVDIDFAREVAGFVERYRPVLEALANDEREITDRRAGSLHPRSAH
jgi:hypothetical protein